MLRDRLAQWFAKAAMGWLLLAALMGVWIRWQAWGAPPLVFNSRFLTHAHSHLMFLGWVYNALAAILIYLFLPERINRFYLRIWVGLQVGLLGMAFSFPIQGYAVVSIGFSTLHMILAGWLGLRIWLDADKSGVACIALRWAVIFLFISAAGPFALGYVTAKGGQETIWYNLAIYFYLHFQYNGWMFFALLAILLRLIPGNADRARLAVHLMATGCMATYAVSTLWASPPLPVYFLAALGAFLQLGGALLLIRMWRTGTWASVWQSGWSHRLASLAFYSFLLKLAIQIIALLPGMGSMVFLNRNWLIAYFHLVFIGVITMAVAAIFVEKNWLPAGRRHAPGWWLLIGGYVITELVLGLPRTSAGVLFLAALSMLIGLLWLAARPAFSQHGDR